MLKGLKVKRQGTIAYSNDMHHLSPGTAFQGIVTPALMRPDQFFLEMFIK